MLTFMLDCMMFLDQRYLPSFNAFKWATTFVSKRNMLPFLAV